MSKKVWSILLSMAMVAGLMTGCGSKNPADGDKKESEKDIVKEEEQQSEEKKVDTSVEITGGYQVNTDLDLETEIVLELVGPAVFENGEEDTVDLLSGLTKPGYKVIVERWNELYPNVKLKFNVCPWDSWRNYITTACLEGNADVILHGGLMTDLAEDLTPYLEAESEYREQIYTTVTLRDSEDLTKAKVSGIAAHQNPMVVWVDTEKFEHFGVDLPADDWTIEDMLSIAEQLTGKDPVTGEDAYGILIPWSGGANILNNHWLISQIYGAEIFEYGKTPVESTVNYTCEESVRAFQMIADFAQYESSEAKEGINVSAVLDGNNNWAMTAVSNPVGGYFEMEAAGLQGRYKAYNYPVIEVGEKAGNSSPAYFDGNLAIYKESDAKEWAWEFIKFMTTDEVAIQWLVDGLKVPNNRDAQEMLVDLLDERTASVMGNSLDSLSKEEYISNTTACYNNISFGPTTTNLQTAVEDVVNGRKTPQEAAEFMQSTIEEYLKSVE